MSKITRFIPKAERIKREQAEAARQAVLALDLPDLATEDILITLQRHETGGAISNWAFNMISPQQCNAVLKAIDASDPKPLTTYRVFIRVLTHVETNTGIVTLSRDELANLCNLQPGHVSAAMKRLEDLGAVVRERVRVPGMRGPGKARYRINPHVAWNGKLDRREVAAEQTRLPFDVIDGDRA